jgi:hypothetical protein
LAVYGSNEKVNEEKALEVNMEVAKLSGLSDPTEAFTYTKCLNSYWMA